MLNYTLFIYIIAIISLLAICGIIRNTFYIHKLVKLEEKKLNMEMEKEPTPQFLSNSLNYENDIQFLHNMIDDTITDRIQELTIIKVDYLNGKEYRQIVEDICFKVRDRLSDNYTHELKKYFSDDGLDEYMIKKIQMKVINYIGVVNRPR